MISKVTEKKELNVAAVDRAISILNAFSAERPILSLHDLAEATGLYKSTILRLLSSLEKSECVIRQPDGTYRLGLRVFHWGNVSQTSMSLETIINSKLRHLCENAGEVASFYKHLGNVRVCLFRVDPQRAVRANVMPGGTMPLGIGAPGRILVDFLKENILRKGIPQSCVYVSYGETDPEVTGISAPVFGPQKELVGALCLSGPMTRIGPEEVRYFARLLIEAAIESTSLLGGDPTLLSNLAEKTMATLPVNPASVLPGASPETQTIRSA